MKCLVAWLAGLMVIAGLGGCASSLPKARSLSVVIIASSDVNPDRSGVPSPVNLRILQLRNDTKFRSASSLALIDNPQTALGADLIAADEQMLRPGERREWNLELQANTEFLGVIAAFQNVAASARDLERAPKQKTLPGLGVDLSRNKGTAIKVGRDSIKFGEDKP